MREKDRLKQNLDEKIRGFVDELYHYYKEKYGVTMVAKYFSQIINETEERFSNHLYFQQLKDPEQSWKARRGSILEQLFQRNIKDSINEALNLQCSGFSKRELGGDYDEVARQISVNMAGVDVQPDADLIVYDKGPPLRVIAILSIKKKFRERIAQVAYWTVKLRATGRMIKNFMVTTDENGTFSVREYEKEDVQKAIAIAEADIDGTFVAAETPTIESDKIKPYERLFEELRRLKDAE